MSGCGVDMFKNFMNSSEQPKKEAVSGLSEEEASERVKSLLKEKYSNDFEVISVKYSPASSVFSESKYVFSMKDKDGNIFEASLFQSGTLSDCYTSILWKEPFAAYVQELIDPLEYVADYSFEYYVYASNNEATADEDLFSVMKKRACKVKGKVNILACHKKDFEEKVQELFAVLNDNDVFFSITFSSEFGQVNLLNLENAPTISIEEIEAAMTE